MDKRVQGHYARFKSDRKTGDLDAEVANFYALLVEKGVPPALIQIAKWLPLDGQEGATVFYIRETALSASHEKYATLQREN